MKIYNYNNDGVYSSESDARIDPAETKRQGEDVFLIPKRTTVIIPPETTLPEVAVFDEDAQTWSVVEDNRRRRYFMSDEWGEAFPQHVMETFGPLPDGASLERPPIPQEEIDKENITILFDDKAEAVNTVFMAMDLVDRTRVFDLQDKIVRCLYNQDEEMALALSEDLRPTSLRDQILNIINA